MELSADKKTCGDVRFAKKVGIIDLASRKLVQTIAVGRSPHGIYFYDRALARRERRVTGGENDAAPDRCIRLGHPDLAVRRRRSRSFKFNLMDYDEDTDALYWVIVGALQMVLMFVLLRPLEALLPVERWTNRRAVRVDVIYTAIAKLGIYSLFFFFALQPLFDNFQACCLHGVANLNLDYQAGRDLEADRHVRDLSRRADFAGYWYHRWQHKFGIWWELHAVHHSQRQMSLGATTATTCSTT